jgi:glycerophosphoryl diester phosphodiesterase
MPLLRHDRWRFTLRSRIGAEEDMAAVLDRIPAGCAVLVDLKTDDVLHAKILVELLAETGRPPEGWYVSGKDAGALAIVAAAGYRTWLSVSTRPEFVGALNGLLPPDLDGIAVRHTFLDEATVGRLRQHQPRVIAWTVDKLYQAEELADLGVAGITSDNPAVHRFVASR